MSMQVNSFWMFAAAATAAITASLTGAGDAAAQPSAQEDEIVVTATRREARLQDVPVAVTPVTAEMIQNSGIRDLQDLTSVAPSLQFNVSENETSATARLRGIGTQGSNPGLESAVGILVDGVYRARNGVALTDLGEISQVEVLRGPQGTLFGRNTTAGLISVNTAGPSLSTYSGDVEATYGDYSETRLAGSITGPLVEDVLGFRLFGATATRDGFIDVVDAAGGVRDVNNRDVWTLRGQLRYEPTPDISARLILDYSDRDEICCAARIYDPEIVNGATATFPPPTAAAVAALGGFGPDGAAALGSGDFETRVGFANREYTQQVEDWGVSGEVNWDVLGGQLTSVTAYRDWTFSWGQDMDFSAADIWYRTADGAGFGFEVFTQEFRFSAVTGPLDWLVGVYYADERLTRRDNVTVGSQYADYFGLIAPGSLVAAGLPSTTAADLGVALAATLAANAEGESINDYFKQNGESIALFTHNIWSIDDKTEVTVGLRYTADDKSVKAFFETGVDTAALTAGTSPFLASFLGFPWLRDANDAAPIMESREERQWSGIVSLRREITDNVSTYASYSEGYKAGGFNLDREFDGSLAFEEETVSAYELGLKSALMGGQLLANAAIYYNQFDNFQLNTFNGSQFVVTSIPEAISQGVELDLIWRTPVEGLSYQGGVAYTEAEYGSFTPAPGQSARLPNSRLTNAPLWSLTNSVTYEKGLFNDATRGLVYFDTRYASAQNTGSDLNPTKVQEGYWLVNGRLALYTPDDRYGVELWGRNLFDEDYAQIMFDVPLQTGAYGAFLGDPRTYGVTVRARY